MLYCFRKEWYSLLRCQRVKNESVSYLRFDGHFSLVFYLNFECNSLDIRDPRFFTSHDNIDTHVCCTILDTKQSLCIFILNFQVRSLVMLEMATSTPSCCSTHKVWSRTQFYSVDFSGSRIGVKKCVFNNRTIKVCVSCS